MITRKDGYLLVVLATYNLELPGGEVTAGLVHTSRGQVAVES